MYVAIKYVGEVERDPTVDLKEESAVLKSRRVKHHCLAEVRPQSQCKLKRSATDREPVSLFAYRQRRCVAQGRRLPILRRVLDVRV